MPTYVDNVLGANERIVRRAHLHWMMYVWPVFWTVISVGLLIFITIPWLIAALIRQLTTDLVVTDKRLIHKSGLITRKVVELRLAKIESIRIDQGLLGRMLDYGTLTVTGTGISATKFTNISEPLAFKQALEGEMETFEQKSQVVAA